MSRLPIVRGRAPLCKCGCGHRVSTIRTEYILGHRPPKPLIDRLAKYIDVQGPDDCWEWTGWKARNGYGTVYVEGRKIVAHRAVWKEVVGPVDDDLHLDHLCRNRACCNPDHLEPVTAGENVRRAGAVQAAVAARLAKLGDKCPNGHLRSEHTRFNSAGHRRCRECSLQATRRYYANKKAAGQ